MPLCRRRYGAVLTLLLLVALGVVGTAAAADAAAASSGSSQASPLLQFTAGGHVLGFERGGLYVASADHLVRIDFAGGRSVEPQTGRDSAGGAAAGGSESAAGTSPGDVAPLERVAYRDVWPGVTVVYTGAGSGAILKSSYSVAAGDPAASAGRISLAYNRDVSIDASGELVVAYEGGELRESAPVAWQTIAGVRLPVQVRFRLLGERRVGFAVGACDPRHPLVIDPSLTWVAFFGGGSDDYSRFIARDPTSGALYVVGDSTASWQGSAAPVNAYADKTAAYVAKLSADGALLWNTFLGGTGEDTGNGIALDSSGNIYATGTSDATWGTPVNAYSGGTDAWIAKLDPTTGVRTWNTFLGSADRDQGFSVAVGGSDVYVGGWSNTSWGSPLNPHDGDNDYCAFVAKLDTSGALQWNTFLGPNGLSENPDTLPSTWLAADASNVYVSGVCAETWSLVGSLGALTPGRAYTSGYDGYAAKLDSDGLGVWYTFLGGSGDDLAFGITAPVAGNLYVCGSSTVSWSLPQPLPPPIVAHSPGTQYDGFLVKLSGSTGDPAWNTFFGAGGTPAASFEDDANALALDSSGNVYVAGASWATWGVSPSRTFSVSTDGFLAKFNTSGVRQWNTFLGGSGTGDQSWGVAVAADGTSYSAGFSNATWEGTSAPVRPYTLSYDGFVAKVSSSGTLQWNTFQGGGSDCFSRWIARDASNNLFVVGDCTATWGTPLRSFQGTRDAFVAKLSSGGTLQWNTFLGSAGTDNGYGIGLDGSGNIYVTGTSTSTWPNSPTPLNPYSGDTDVFVTRLTSAGAVSWNTFMGSAATDQSFSLAMGSSPDEALYVGGWSNATWGSPVRAHEGNGVYDAFVARVSTAGAVVWNTFLGGYGTTLNPPNNIPNTWVATVGTYVCASAVCNQAWAVTNMTPVRPYTAGYDGYGVRMAAGSGVIDAYAFLGGTGTDIVYGIAFDTLGNAYFSGSSNANWGTPLVAYGGTGTNYQAWAVKMDNTGIIKWNTFFGSTTQDNDGNAVAADTAGNVYVVGTTYGGSWGTPWRSFTGGEAGFIAKFTSGGAFLWNGFLGGVGKDDAWGVVLDGNASAYVVGGSDATWGSPAASSAFKDGTDGFVAAVALPGAVWTGAVDDKWSTAGNWAGGSTPAANEALAFPVGAARKAITNDLLNSVGQVTFAEGGYGVTGNAVTLNDSGTAMSSTGDNTWGLDTAMPNNRNITSLSGTLTMSGVISGPGTLTKYGTGDLTLSGANTYTGNTQIAEGTLNAANIVVSGGASNLGNSTAAPIAGQSGTNLGMLNYTGTNATFTRGLSTSRGGGISVATSGVTLTVETGGLVASGGTLTLGGAGTLVVNSVVSGPGSLAKIGAGTLTLGSANTYVGTSRIYEGTLVASTLDYSAPSSLGQPTSNSARTIALGDTGTKGKLQYTGPTLSTNRSIVLSAGGGEIATTNTLTLPGVVSGAGGLTTSGPGVIELGGTNTYAGDTTIASGTVRQITNNNRFPYGAGKGNVTVVSGATLDLNRWKLAINGLSGGGTVTNRSSALSTYLDVGYNDATSTFSGVISDVGADPGLLRLTKYGAGTLTLTGASTYIGATTVSAGTLLVNGSILAVSPASDPVQAGATLGGSGTVSSAVTIYGVLAPGTTVGSIGTLRTLRQNWYGGGQYTVDINDTLGPPGDGYDYVDITSGDLAIWATAVNRFTIKLTGTAAHYTSGGSYRWPILHYAGAIYDFDVSKFTLDTSGFTNDPSGTGMTLELNAPAKTIDIVHVSHPTAVTVASFGAKLRKGHVVASWRTASLGDTVGFFLYRKSLRTGRWRLVTRQLVPAQFGKPAGATYRVTDRGAPTGRRLTYRLKEISSGGGVTWHGPYRVRPRR